MFCFFSFIRGWSLVSSSSLLPSSLLPDMVGGLAASSAMLSPVVQTVLQMGFEASLVESLVQTKYLLTGQQYTSVSDLVSDVLQAEQEDRQRGPQSRGNTVESNFTQVWYSSTFLTYLYIHFLLFLHFYSTTIQRETFFFLNILYYIYITLHFI